MIELFIGGSALLFALLHKSKPVTAKQSVPPPAPSQSAGGGLDLSKLATGGVVGTGVALAKLGGDLGYAITGTQLGRVAGTANAIYGNVINVGAVAGDKVNDALGGSGNTTASKLAQVSGGATAGTLAVIGALASVGVFQITALVYVVGRIFGHDHNQDDARKEYDAEWGATHGRFYAALRGGMVADAQFHAVAITDGYMRFRNKRAYWIARNVGADLQSAQSDGRFVGNVSPRVSASLPGELFNEPPLKSQFPSLDIQTAFGSDVYRYNPAYEMQRQASFKVGESLANVGLYRAWQAKVSSGFLTHAVAGKLRGEFEGSIVGDGLLAYAGQTFDFREPLK